jgi:hypothetical protein
MALAAGIQVLWAGVRVHAAPVPTGVGVDASFQAQAVNVSGYIGHVAILLTRLNGRPLFGIDHDVACCIVSVPEHPLHFGPQTSITTPLWSKGRGFCL